MKNTTICIFSVKPISPSSDLISTIRIMKVKSCVSQTFCPSLNTIQRLTNPQSQFYYERFGKNANKFSIFFSLFGGCFLTQKYFLISTLIFFGQKLYWIQTRERTLETKTQINYIALNTNDKEKNQDDKNS